MKKIISLILVAVLFVSALLLVSCNEATTDGGAQTNAETTEASGNDTESAGGDDIVVPDVTLNYPAYTVYVNAEHESYAIPTAANLSSWFAESTEFDEDFNILTPAAFESISEYVLHMPSGRSAIEIDVFKIADSGDAEAVKALAEYRKVKVDGSDLRLYDDAADELLKTATVITVGPFAIYLCTENTEVSSLRAQKFYAENPGCSALELYGAIVSDIK